MVMPSGATAQGEAMPRGSATYADRQAAGRPAIPPVILPAISLMPAGPRPGDLRGTGSAQTPAQMKVIAMTTTQPRPQADLAEAKRVHPASAGKMPAGV